MIITRQSPLALGRTIAAAILLSAAMLAPVAGFVFLGNHDGATQTAHISAETGNWTGAAPFPRSR